MQIGWITGTAAALMLAAVVVPGSARVERGIEKRRTRFERVGHRAAIDFDEQVVE